MTVNHMKVIRGGQLIDVLGHNASQVDILIKNDTIIEIGRPGL